MARAHSTAALLLLAPLHCSRTPTPPEPARARGVESNRPLASSGSSAPSAPSGAEPAPDGCYAAVDPRVDAEALLAALARRCTEGMLPVLSRPQVTQLGQGGKSELKVTISDPSRCVRAIAAGSEGVREIELSVVDGAERSYGTSQIGESYALVTPHGSVCVKAPGVYRAIARVRRGAGKVAVQIYQAE